MLPAHNARSATPEGGCASSRIHARIFSWTCDLPDESKCTRWFFEKNDSMRCHVSYKPFAQWKGEGDRGKEPALTSDPGAGFTTSLPREVSVEAERGGPHLGCFGVSTISLFSAPCSLGKSNLVNSNSGLEAGPHFSMILDFLSVRLW